MTNVEKLLQEYRNEVNIAVSSFYTWKTINGLAKSDDKVLCALNTNGLSWSIIAHSLQITFLTVLGRIFDNNPRSLTVNSFICKCRDAIRQFSKASLEVRRLNGSHGVRPDYLDDHLKDACEPSSADFDALDRAAQKYKTIYQKNYHPIRNKLIAHKDYATMGSRDSLYAKTNIGEIEELLLFLHQIEKVVDQWYLNGRMTDKAKAVACFL